MNTTPTTPVQTTLVEDNNNHILSRHRATIACIAFLAILRRDLLVTWRDLLGILVQVLLQPLFFLFIFGAILPNVGVAQQGFATLLLPGIVSLTIITSALQSVTLPLVLDLGVGHEIDDRLLAPLPVGLVAIEKVIFASIRGLLAGAVIFPLACLILGNAYQVRTDAIGVVIGLMIFTAFVGASMGLLMGTLVPPAKIGLIFSLILTPLIFTGCTYYPWATLASIRWFQIVTLFNPLTYASEGLRYAMIPNTHNYVPTTLGMGWIILGLGASFIIFLMLGISTFYKRVIM